MKKTSFFRMIIIPLVIIMTFSLSACGKKLTPEESVRKELKYISEGKYELLSIGTGF